MTIWFLFVATQLSICWRMDLMRGLGKRSEIFAITIGKVAHTSSGGSSGAGSSNMGTNKVQDMSGAFLWVQYEFCCRLCLHFGSS